MDIGLQVTARKWMYAYIRTISSFLFHFKFVFDIQVNDMLYSYTLKVN